MSPLPKSDHNGINSFEFDNGQKVTYAENMGLCLSEEYDPGFECDTNYKTNLFDCDN